MTDEDVLIIPGTGTNTIITYIINVSSLVNPHMPDRMRRKIFTKDNNHVFTIVAKNDIKIHNLDSNFLKVDFAEKLADC